MVLSLILECQNFLNKKGKCDDKSNWIISSLVWTGIIWSVIFMVGIELDANERIRTGLGYMLISALIEIGFYLLNGGF